MGFYGAAPQNVELNPTDLGNTPNARGAVGVALGRRSHPSCLADRDSLLASSSYSDSNVLPDKLQRRVRRSETRPAEYQFGATRRQSVTTLKISLRAFVGVATLFLR